MDTLNVQGHMTGRLLSTSATLEGLPSVGNDVAVFFVACTFFAVTTMLIELNYNVLGGKT